MGYWGTYKAAPIKANVVPEEGIYQVKILEVTEGVMKTGKHYTQVKTAVNSEGYPQLSLFLTEGDSFDGQVTAFYDTFAIPRGNQDPDTWKGRKGYIRITLAKKDNFTNMVPHYILDENGYVKPRQPEAVTNLQNVYSGSIEAAPEYDNGYPEGGF